MHPPLRDRGPRIGTLERFPPTGPVKRRAWHEDRRWSEDVGKELRSMTHQEPDPDLEARLERDRREAVVRSIQDGLIVLDDEGTVVEVNARWSAMLGFPPEE